MKLSEWLGVSPGVTALVGSGGKTTLMYRLAAELAEHGTVICTTTTHIYPPSHMPLARLPKALPLLLPQYHCVCMGTPAAEGKLTAPACPMNILAAQADYILVEADGARGRPLKAHLPHEPVIPPEAERVILVVGISGLKQSVRTVVHRWERFCALSGVSPEEAVTVPALTDLLHQEGLGDVVFLNQVENRTEEERAAALAARLNRPVFAGSVRKGECLCLS